MLPAVALLLPPAPAVTLRYQPPIGKPVRLVVVNRMTRTMPGQPPMTMVLNLPLTMTATARSGGNTTVASKAGDPKVQVPVGQGAEKARDAVVAAVKGKTSTIVVDAYSVPKSAVTPGIASTSSLGGFQGVVFPKKPVRVGESWKYDIDAAKIGSGANGAMVAGTVPMRYTLKSVANERGRRVATIAADLNGKLNLRAQGMATPLTIKGGGQFKVDVATGIVLDARMRTDTVVPMGALGTMRQQADLTVKAR